MSEPEDAFFDREARIKLGRTLESWMAYAGVNKSTLARDAGLSRNTLDAILDGSRTASLERLARLAAKLNTSPGALLDGQLPVSSLRVRPNYDVPPPPRVRLRSATKFSPNPKVSILADVDAEWFTQSRDLVDDDPARNSAVVAMHHEVLGDMLGRLQSLERGTKRTRYLFEAMLALRDLVGEVADRVGLQIRGHRAFGIRLEDAEEKPGPARPS